MPAVADTPATVRRWGTPPPTATRVVGRRVVQCAIDIATSSVLPLLSLALFLAVPVSPDGTTVSVKGLVLTSAVVVIVAFSVYAWYWVVYPVRQRGQTWGMRMLGIRVVRANGLPVGTRALIIRWLMLLVDGLALGLVGLIAMLTSPRHQRLGDIAAGTVVVRDKAEQARDHGDPRTLEGPPRRSSQAARTPPTRPNR